MNLRKSRKEILEDEDIEKMMEVMLDWRDRRLLEVIDQQLQRHENAEISIALLFGAQHMRAVIHHLVQKRGYRVAKGEWTTVFTL